MNSDVQPTFDYKGPFYEQTTDQEKKDIQRRIASYNTHNRVQFYEMKLMIFSQIIDDKRSGITRFEDPPKACNFISQQDINDGLDLFNNSPQSHHHTNFDDTIHPNIEQNQHRNEKEITKEFQKDVSTSSQEHSESLLEKALTTIQRNHQKITKTSKLKSGTRMSKFDGRGIHGKRNKNVKKKSSTRKKGKVIEHLPSLICSHLRPHNSSDEKERISMLVMEDNHNYIKYGYYMHDTRCQNFHSKCVLQLRGKKNEVTITSKLHAYRCEHQTISECDIVWCHQCYHKELMANRRIHTT